MEYILKNARVYENGNLNAADVLVRGNTSTRSFLMPILDKKNNLVNSLVSEVALLKVLLGRENLRLYNKIHRSTLKF